MCRTAVQPFHPTALAHRDRGATAAEYAIVVTLIAVVIAVGVAVFGLAVAGLFAVPGGL